MLRSLSRGLILRRNFQISKRIFTEVLDTDYLKKKIELLETEIKVQDQNYNLETRKEASPKVYKIMQELVDLCIQARDLEKATKICAELYKRTKRFYGERHLMMIEVYYQTAHVSFYTGFFHQAYNDYVEINQIKNNAKITGVKIENEEKDKEVANFLAYFSEFFQNIILSEQDKVTLHLDDPVVPLSKIAEYFPQNKRIQFTERFLLRKVNEWESKKKDDQNLVLKYQNLFLLYRKLGNLQKMNYAIKESLNYYEKANDYCLEAYGKFHPIYASFLADYTEILFETDETTAERLAKHATVVFARISPEKLSENPEYEIQIAKACIVLVKIYRKTDPGEAVKYLSIALQIIARITGKNTLEWKNAAIDYAYCLIVIDELEKANEFLEKDLWPILKDGTEIEKGAFWKTKHLYYLKNQQYNLAKTSLLKAIEILEPIEDAENIEYDYTQLTQIYYTLKDKVNVIKLCNERLSKINRVLYPEIAKSYQVIRDKVERGIWIDSHSDNPFNNIVAEEYRKWKLMNLQTGVRYKDETEEKFYFQTFLTEKAEKDIEFRKIVEKRTFTKTDIEETINLLREKYGDDIVTKEIEDRIRVLAKSPHNVQSLHKLNEGLHQEYVIKTDPHYGVLLKKYIAERELKGKDQNFVSKEQIADYMEAIKNSRNTPK